MNDRIEAHLERAVTVDAGKVGAKIFQDENVTDDALVIAEELQGNGELMSRNLMVEKKRGLTKPPKVAIMVMPRLVATALARAAVTRPSVTHILPLLRRASTPVRLWARASMAFSRSLDSR